jgi:formylglycine-generating enzyme
MVRTWLARAAWLLAAGCGRVGFDQVADAPVADGANVSGAASCAALAAACGPMASESCCASPTIPGGTFDRSYDVGSDGAYPDMAHPASVSAFRLDRFEITVGRFRAFVTSGLGTQQDPPAPGDGAHPRIADSGWDASWNTALAATTADLSAALVCNNNATWTALPGANETLPINCITWYEAMAFCAWDGGYLPSEAEWNFAAAGGDEQRAYPWSSPPPSLAIDCQHANYMPGANECVTSTITALPVGSESPLGDAKWGQADLAGNVWELVLDTYDTAYPAPCTDCAALDTPAMRCLRGGGGHDGANELRGALRTSVDPTNRLGHVNQGARCARAPS